MNRNAQSFLFLLIILWIPHSAYSSEPLRGPIAIYLTWQEDPSTTMTVQWITDMHADNDEVLYQKEGGEDWEAATGSHTQMPKSQTYRIHRVALANLSPDTVYHFSIGGWGHVTHKFRTMPSSPDKPFRFVVGGDMFAKDPRYMIYTTVQAAKQDPMFALLGGDLAYAAEKSATKINPDEARKWLVWLKIWTEYMITPEGFMVPIIPAIGNHDTQGRYEQTPEKALFFYALFPFPGKQGYNVLDFGRYMSVVVLDTDHTHPIPGNQAKWLSLALQYRQHVAHKFALYHVGAYPSVRKYTGARARKIRQHWVPSFEKYGLSAAFEHHDHAYKRTRPILKGRRHPDGVIYLGDGAWGPKKVRKPHSPTKRWYLAYSKRTRNFILVTIDGKKRIYQGIDPAGNVIDSYSED